jgi:hypothetical protein
MSLEVEHNISNDDKGRSNISVSDVKAVVGCSLDTECSNSWKGVG